MKYSLVGDPHAKPSNLEKINRLFDMVEDLGNPVIILGDLLDTKEVVRGKCLNTYLRRLKGSQLHFTILVGNHDWHNLECEEHSLEALKSLPNVTVVDTPVHTPKVSFLPYIHDVEKLRSELNDCSGKVVFCHADIFGFDYGNGLISDGGLQATELSRTKRVISGHYHKYQVLGNITYLGTPFSHSFGESNQDKFIGVYDTGTDKLELLPTPFPRHTTQEIDCAKQLDHTFNDIDHQRVILRGTQEEIDRVMRQDHVKYIEQPTSLVRAATIDESASPEVQFAKWARDIKGYSDEILNLGLEVLADV